MKKEKNSIQRVIGIYETLSGMIGAILIIYAVVVSSSLLDIKLIFIALLGLTFYLLNMIAGVFLFKNDEKGYKLSILSQFIQIVSFSSASFKYIICSGSFLGIGFLEKELSVKLDIFYVEYMLSYSTNIESYIYVNIVSLGLLFFLIASFLNYKKFKRN
jgi:hypothetical protein